MPNEQPHTPVHAVFVVEAGLSPILVRRDMTQSGYFKEVPYAEYDKVTASFLYAAFRRHDYKDPVEIITFASQPVQGGYEEMYTRLPNSVRERYDGVVDFAAAREGKERFFTRRCGRAGPGSWA